MEFILTDYQKKLIDPDAELDIDNKRFESTRFADYQFRGGTITYKTMEDCRKARAAYEARIIDIERKVIEDYQGHDFDAVIEHARKLYAEKCMDISAWIELHCELEEQRDKLREEERERHFVPVKAPSPSSAILKYLRNWFHNAAKQVFREAGQDYDKAWRDHYRNLCQKVANAQTIVYDDF